MWSADRKVKANRERVASQEYLYERDKYGEVDYDKMRQIDAEKMKQFATQQRFIRRLKKIGNESVEDGKIAFRILPDRYTLNRFIKILHKYKHWDIEGELSIIYDFVNTINRLMRIIATDEAQGYVGQEINLIEEWIRYLFYTYIKIHVYIHSDVNLYCVYKSADKMMG